MYDCISFLLVIAILTTYVWAVSSQCMTGWALFGNGCYLAEYITPLSWDNAQAQCETTGGDLVTVTTPEQWNSIETLLTAGQTYWIGLNDKATQDTYSWIAEGFVWTYSLFATSGHFARWLSAEPNDNIASCFYEDHRSSTASAGWVAGPCETRRGYICQMSLCEAGHRLVAGSCWIEVPSSIVGGTAETWDNAEADCIANYDGHLVLLDSTEIEEYVTDWQQPTMGSKEFWIGLNDKATEGEFIWTRNMNPLGTFSKWRGRDRPPRVDNMLNCVKMVVPSVPSPSYGWIDVSCGDKNNYICERVCDPSRTVCADGVGCITSTQRCDGTDDCADMSDETNPGCESEYEFVDEQYYVMEGNALTIRVKRTGTVLLPGTLTLEFEDITAKVSPTMTDITTTGVAGVALTFAEGQAYLKQVILLAVNDDIEEPVERFSVKMSATGRSGGRISDFDTTTVFIDEFKATSLFTFDKDHYVVTEGDMVSIKICRESTGVNSADLVLQVRNVDAQSPNDFNGIIPGPITFNNDALKSNTIQITTAEDSKVERQESFELVLLSSNIEISNATVWIHDDDVRYCFDSKACVVTEGDEAAYLDIVKEGDLQDTKELTVRTSDIDALSGSDYTQYTTSTLVIAKGESVTEIKIPIGKDDVWEPVECFKVHIEDGNGNMICAATVLIKDDDAMCSPPCINGATCVSPNTCLCPTDFTGPTCETALCNSLCSNGGTCISPNTCLCPSLYSGLTCETVLCYDRCQNGGVCIPYTNTCWCPSGFDGESCEMSLCVSPCENGGVCSATGNCLCPSGLTGSQCEIIQLSTTTETFIIEGQVSIIATNGVAAVYDSQMNVAGSPEREAVLATITPLLYNALLNNMVDFSALRFGLFSPGSINMKYDVILPSTSQSTNVDVDRGVASLITTAPLSGVTINPDPSFTFTRPRGVCQAGYCQNGGSCMADSSGTRSVCICTSSYTGSRCEENVNDLSEGEIAGIILGVVLFLLLLVLVTVTFFAYMRRNRVKEQPVTYPNTNTLDLASSPYSYPRSPAIFTQNQLMF